MSIAKKLRPTQIREKQMKKQLIYSLLAIVTIGLTGCSSGYYVSNSHNVNLNQTQVVLSQANFQVVKQLSVTYVYTNENTQKFDANQMKESAYAALVKKANLTGAQTIINVTMEQIQRKSQSFWTILFAPKCEQAVVVSGTVIEFLPEGVKPTHSSVVESSVVYENTQETTVKSATNESKVVTDETSETKVSKYDEIKKLYAKSDSKFFKVYEKVRQNMLSNKRLEELDAIEDFLLNGEQSNIEALKSGILRCNGIDMQTNVFVNYTRKM